MATSSITTNFCISAAQGARTFVDRFVVVARRRTPSQVRKHTRMVAVMNDPAEIQHFAKPREQQTTSFYSGLSFEFEKTPSLITWR